MCVCLFVGVGGVSVVLCVSMQTVSSNVTKHTVLSARAAGVGGSGSSRRSPGGGGASVHARLHRPAAGATGRVGGALQRHHHGPYPHHHRADDRHRSPPGGARPLLLRRRRKSLQLAPHAHRRWVCLAMVCWCLLLVGRRTRRRRVWSRKGGGLGPWCVCDACKVMRERYGVMCWCREANKEEESVLKKGRMIWAWCVCNANARACWCYC